MANAENVIDDRRSAWRAIGFWMSVPIGLLQAVNVARVVLDPLGFSSYIGLPVSDPMSTAWVQVYGLRTAFITLLVAIFLIRRNLEALKWTALAGLLMPIGDALLTQRAGAPIATVARHAAIAVYLLITFLMLRAWTRKAAR